MDTYSYTNEDLRNAHMFIGNFIANGGKTSEIEMMLARLFHIRKNLEIENEKLQTENEKLREKVERLTAISEVRQPVSWFASKMELVLRENDHKKHWRTCRRSDMLRRIQGEYTELKNAIRNGAEKSQIIKEAVDVANFCMMVADLTEHSE